MEKDGQTYDESSQGVARWLGEEKRSRGCEEGKGHLILGSLGRGGLMLLVTASPGAPSFSPHSCHLSMDRYLRTQNGVKHISGTSKPHARYLAGLPFRNPGRGKNVQCPVAVAQRECEKACDRPLSSRRSGSRDIDWEYKQER